MTVSVLIVDDEAMARNRIRRLLSREAEVTVLGECSNGREAVEAIETLKPDLVFLDVQMPELDGFAVLEALDPANMPSVIFVTAYDSYAIRAFEVNALDYLLKPFNQARFSTAFERACAHLQRQQPQPVDPRLVALLEQLGADGGPRKSQYLERVMVKTDGRIIFVKTPDVHWIEAYGNYVKLHVGAESYLVRGTMASWESNLDPIHFVRIHRSAIVNLEHVKELQPWFGGDYTVSLRTGRKLKMSRWYRHRLQRHMVPAER